MQYIDEAKELTRKQIRAMRQLVRAERAGFGWWNWYASRGHFHREKATASDLRRVSWRRAL